MSFFDWMIRIQEMYGPLLLKGTGSTILLAIIGTFVGSGIGLLIGIYKTIPMAANANPIKKFLYKFFDFILSAYIEVFRSTPMMVQAMMIFYGIAMLYGVTLPRFAAGLLIISVNTGAYMSEIVRGGIISIDHGQYEAAHSIGMTHGQTMTNIVLPQAIRNIMPAIGNEFIINMKDSCVLSVIGVTELFYVAKFASGATFQTFPTMTIAAVYYFILCFTTTKILRYIEKKMDGPDSYTIHGSQTVPEAEIKVGGIH